MHGYHLISRSASIMAKQSEGKKLVIENDLVTFNILNKDEYGKESFNHDLKSRLFSLKNIHMLLKPYVVKASPKMSTRAIFPDN